MGLKTLSGFPLSVLRPSNWHCSNPGISERSDQMRIRTIAAALAVAAPLLALGSPQAAACWGTDYGYGLTASATPIAPRRHGYMSYGYSCLLWWLLRWHRHPPGWLPGVGWRSAAIGVGRVGVGRIGRVDKAPQDFGRGRVGVRRSWLRLHNGSARHHLMCGRRSSTALVAMCRDRACASWPGVI